VKPFSLWVLAALKEVRKIQSRVACTARIVDREKNAEGEKTIVTLPLGGAAPLQRRKSEKVKGELERFGGKD